MAIQRNAWSQNAGRLRRRWATDGYGNMNKELSLIRVIQTDYIASLSVLFPIVFWIFIVVLLVMEKEVAFLFLMIALVISVIALIVLLWRINIFQSIFDDGLETPAIVNDISFFRGRGHVTYVYTFQGPKYYSSNFIQKTKRAQALVAGDQVILVVDRNNPQRAFIRDLYT